jgi:DNA-directed RNA polymerase-5 subunit 1
MGKTTNQQTMSIPVIDCSLTKMPTDGKLHTVPCVQFSFFDNNTIFSESVEGAVNVIADSIGSMFSTIIS